MFNAKASPVTPTSSAEPECFNNDSMTWQVQLWQAMSDGWSDLQ